VFNQRPLSCLLTLLLAILCMSCDSRKAPPSPCLQSVVGQISESLMAIQKEENIPVLAWAVVTSHDVIHIEVCSNANANTQSIFSIQSQSKMFTALAVLIAVEEGIVDLNQPVRKYLPDFHLQSAYDEDPLCKMTLMHMLSHTAGFTHEAPLGNNFGGDKIPFDDHIKSIQQTWLKFPVGNRASYSNLGIDLAAFIIEKQAHSTLNAYLQQKLFKPLAMNRTSFDYSWVAQQPNVIEPADRSIFNHLPQVPMIPSGGLFSTVADMAKYLQFQLRAGQGLISPQMLTRMRQLPSPLPEQINGYGLGIVIDKIGLYKVYYHDGGGFGYASTSLFIPQADFGIVILTNRYNFKFKQALLSILQRHLSDEHEHLSSKQIMGKFPSGTYLGKDGIVNLNEKTLFEKLGPGSYIATTQNIATITRQQDGSVWILNDDDESPPGPNSPHWHTYIGTYKEFSFGNKIWSRQVHVKNGYLYLDDMRLQEHKTGLFFTVDGETLDLRNQNPTWRNIPLSRK
jgi:CubicO group peptidase (beta-lactamase class C family)